MQLLRLSDNASITLPDALLWTDEHAWTAAVAKADYTLSGALIVQSATRQAGRPITLAPPEPAMAWVTRATAEQLHLWAGVPLTATSGRFRLTFADARQFTVAFRHAETAVESEPVLGVPHTTAGDYYRVTLRLLTIE